jgi:hypothetical protein
MTMQFAVAPKENLSKIAPGARVDFQLSNSKASHLRVRQTQLENVNVETPKNQLAIGDPVPDFSLISLSARRVHAQSDSLKFTPDTQNGQDAPEASPMISHKTTRTEPFTPAC